MSELNSIIQSFRKFLIQSWTTIITIVIEEKDNGDDFLNDWYQANWEILVELRVGRDLNQRIFLVVYGYGADCNGSSSRVWEKDALPTHEVFCVSDKPVLDIFSNKEINVERLTFDRFVAFNGEKYFDSTPFDFILLSDTNGNSFLVHEKDVRFSLKTV